MLSVDGLRRHSALALSLLPSYRELLEGVWVLVFNRAVNKTTTTRETGGRGLDCLDCTVSDYVQHSRLQDRVADFKRLHRKQSPLLQTLHGTWDDGGGRRRRRGIG